MADPELSIIIPVLDEAAGITAALERLAPWRDCAEVIVVDGGSSDSTAALARPLCDQLLTSRRGRARQMNAGASTARGRYLLFLHSDTQLPESPAAVLRELRETSPQWGFFPVHLSGAGAALRIVEAFMNGRSRLTRVATGDQSLLLARNAWDETGGFADIPLMEDVELCKRLRRLSRPHRMTPAVITSSRRWEERGVLSTVLTMWGLRLAYWLGAPPARLAKIYYGA